MQLGRSGSRRHWSLPRLDSADLNRDSIHGCVPRECIQCLLVGHVVAADTGMLLRYAQANSFAVVTEAVREADDAGHDVGGRFDCDLQCADA